MVAPPVAEAELPNCGVRSRAEIRSSNRLMRSSRSSSSERYLPLLPIGIPIEEDRVLFSVRCRWWLKSPFGYAGLVVDASREPRILNDYCASVSQTKASELRRKVTLHGWLECQHRRLTDHCLLLSEAVQVGLAADVFARRCNIPSRRSSIE